MCIIRRSESIHVVESLSLGLPVGAQNIAFRRKRRTKQLLSTYFCDTEWNSLHFCAHEKKTKNRHWWLPRAFSRKSGLIHAWKLHNNLFEVNEKLFRHFHVRYVQGEKKQYVKCESGLPFFRKRKRPLHYIFVCIMQQCIRLFLHTAISSIIILQQFAQWGM